MAFCLDSFQERNRSARIGRDGLVRELARKFPGRTLVELREIVDALVDTMTEAILAGKRIEIRGFGSFKPHRRGIRRAWSPSSSKLVRVDARWLVKFETGKNLKRDMMANLER